MPQRNISRAELATDALFAGTDYDGEEENDVKTYVGDLIANLKHLCKRDGIDFDSCLRSAENHFSAESDAEPSRVEPATISVGDTNEGCGGGPAPEPFCPGCGGAPDGSDPTLNCPICRKVAKDKGEVEQAVAGTELVERIVCFKIAASVQIDPELSHDIAIDRALAKILYEPYQYATIDNVDAVCDGSFKPLAEDGSPLPKPKAYVVLNNADGNVRVDLVTLDDEAARRKVAEIVKSAGRIADPDDEDALMVDGLRYSIHDSYHEVIAWIDSADISIPV